MNSPATLGPLGSALVTTFGLGHLRPASGTWGSLPPVILAAALIAAGLGPADAPIVFNGTLGAVLIIFTLACAAWGNQAEARFGKKDPSQVVADETAGQCIPLLLLPADSVATWPNAAVTLALAFLAFRAFDILKLWPAHQIQRLSGGWGIVLDDLVAGLQTMILIQIAARTLF